MKYRMLMAQAQNKLYLQMPSDSAFQEIVTYYDAHGTSNEKMRAHYLLGCIFRDQEEAPRAILCYEEAVEKVDTFRSDCDYSILASVYGQMAAIYAKQKLLNKSIDCELKYSSWALKAGDQLSAIGGIGKIAALYYDMGDTTKAVLQAEKCISLFKKKGMVKAAVGIIPLLMDIAIERHQFDKVYHYMQTFEKESGLFDEKGDICKGREYYYFVKGQYFLGINRLDSARVYFEKLDKAGFHFEANKGLLSVYGQLKDIKNVLKYADLCEKNMDEILKQNQADAVLQASSMYNFNKIQQENSKQALAKERAEYTLVILGLIIIILCLGGVQLFRMYKKKLKQKQGEIETHKLRLAESKKEIESWSDKFLNATSELEMAQGKLNGYKEEYKRMKASEKNVIIDDNEVYKLFKKIALGHKGMQTPTEKQWKKMTKVVSENFPIFFEKIRHNTQRQGLSSTEERVAMLTRLHFSTTEMANVMNTSPASISNAKLSVNTKLFGDNNAKGLFQNMLDM